MSSVSRTVLAMGMSAILLAGCAGTASTSVPLPTTTHPAPAPTGTPTSDPTESPSPSPVAWPEGIVAYPVGTGDSPLPYLEHLPPGYGDGSPRPLLVFLHGVDEHADGGEGSLQRILELGVPRLIAEGEWPSERPFIVLMPQEPAAKSGRCDFAPEIERFLQFAVDHYEVDEARIYLTGISCGAIGVWDYLAEVTDDTVAAVVPISGHPVWAMDKAGCAVGRAPIWAFHGGKDDTVPVGYVEDAIDDLHSCTDPAPGELELTIYPDADHDAWTRTYDLSAGNDVYAWLLEHERN